MKTRTFWSPHFKDKVQQFCREIVDLCVEYNIDLEKFIEESSKVDFNKMTQEEQIQFLYELNPDNHNHI